MLIMLGIDSGVSVTSLGGNDVQKPRRSKSCSVRQWIKDGGMRVHSVVTTSLQCVTDHLNGQAVASTLYLLILTIVYSTHVMK